MTSYIGVIHKKDPGIYSLSFPDFPGCIAAGRTLAEAHDMAKNVLAEHIRVKQGYGEMPATPCSMQSVLVNPAFAEAIAYIAIEAEAAARVKRISVTMDELLLARIDAQTSKLVRDFLPRRRGTICA